MMLIRYFLISSLVTLSQSQDYRLPTNSVPKNYKILLNPDVTSENSTFEGNIDIDLEVLKLTKNLTLHASNLTIHKQLTTLKNSSIAIKPINHVLEQETEFLILHFENDLHPGLYKLHIEYTGNLTKGNQGFFKNFYIDDNNQAIFIVATHFEPTSARQAFPCWDEPALKATFEISLKHFPNFTALSNMPEVGENKMIHEDGKIWTAFRKTPLLSTYTLAFTVSDFVNVTNEHGNYSVWTRRNVLNYTTSTFGYEVGLKALKILENYTGIPYSLSKMDVFVVPQYYSSAMENWGLIIIKELDFLEDKDSVGNDELITIGANVCHEIVHQWFGNLVSPAWWSDIWITEGLPSYLQNYVLDQMKLEHVRDTHHPHLFSSLKKLFVNEEEKDCNILYRNISKASKLFRESITLYQKPVVLFHMLSSIMSDDIFKKGIVKILQKFQYKTISTDDFLDVMQETVDESKSPDFFDVKSFLRTYITHVGYPVITVSRDNSTGTIKLTQACSICLENKYTSDNWPIPINYAKESSPDFTTTRVTHWFNSSVKEILIKDVLPNEWFILNKQAIAYYRVNYDNMTWLQISDYLNSKNYSKIHVHNRIQLLDDASWLLSNGKLSKEMFTSLLNYLKQERELLPWTCIEDQLIYFMLYTDQGLKTIVHELVTSVLEELNRENGINSKELTGILEGILSYVKFCYDDMDFCKE